MITWALLLMQALGLTIWIYGYISGLAMWLIGVDNYFFETSSSLSLTLIWSSLSFSLSEAPSYSVTMGIGYAIWADLGSGFRSPFFAIFMFRNGRTRMKKLMQQRASS